MSYYTVEVVRQMPENEDVYDLYKLTPRDVVSYDAHRGGPVLLEDAEVQHYISLRGLDKIDAEINNKINIGLIRADRLNTRAKKKGLVGNGILLSKIANYCDNIWSVMLTTPQFRTYYSSGKDADEARRGLRQNIKNSEQQHQLDMAICNLAAPALPASALLDLLPYIHDKKIQEVIIEEWIETSSGKAFLEGKNVSFINLTKQSKLFLKKAILAYPKDIIGEGLDQSNSQIKEVS